MTLIENSSDLKALCDRLASQPFVTVDLEFLRERTYYAKLCLIQVGSPAECAVIDPLAPELDLKPFFVLMQNPSVTKVFHSGRQDIEIIYNLSRQIPAPLFDTQIAAMVAGFGESISYENLVKHLLGITLDKSFRLSDWSKRPLNARQLEYALSDVTHLVEIYRRLKDLLEKTGRTHWIDEEMQILNLPSTYVTAPHDAWKKIRHHSHNPRFLTLLRELAAWREERCQRRDVPRQRYLRDDVLLAICSVCPQTKEELSEVRSLNKETAAGKLGTEIVDVMRRAAAIPPEEYVTLSELQLPPAGNPALFELLKLLLKIICQKNKIVARLVASDEELNRLSAFQDENCRFLSGWRYEIFGARALELRSGKLIMGYNPQQRCVEFFPSDKN